MASSIDMSVCNIVIFFIYVWNVNEFTYGDILSCTKISACSCKSEKGIIDLSPLSKDGTPRVKVTSESTTYYYNPCHNFDMGTVKDAGVVSYDSKTYKSLGSNKDCDFSTVTGNLQLDLQGPNSNSVTITILCGDSLDFQFQVEFPLGHYAFQLTAREGCPGYKPPKSDEGLSIGSIILIAFFVIVVCYLAFGLTFKIFVRKADGRERIPNVQLWTTLPGLIKDGCKFTFTLGRRSSYDQV